MNTLKYVNIFKLLIKYKQNYKKRKPTNERNKRSDSSRLGQPTIVSVEAIGWSVSLRVRKSRIPLNNQAEDFTYVTSQNDSLAIDHGSIKTAGDESIKTLVRTVYSKE